MGSKTELHLSAWPPAVQTSLADPVLPRRSRFTRNAAVCAVASLLILVASFHPLYCRVDGAPRLIWRGDTAAAVLSAMGAAPGNLLDLQGGLLRPRGGLPPRVWRNGSMLAPEARIQARDELVVTSGADVREPVRERTQLLPDPQLSGYRPPAVAGTRRVQVGLLSGRAVLETVSVVPTVSAAQPTPVRKCVALTFDDGPWPGQTARILAILQQYGAHSTFFVLGGQAKGRPELIRATLAQGCEIAVHTWNHANLVHCSAAAIIADLNHCKATLLGITGLPMRLMRPPYGAVNANARSAIAQTGLRMILWSVDTNDWRRPGAGTIYSRIVNGARNGAIILCHDGGGPRSQTIAAVSRAVPALQARGYELVTVSQLLGLQPRPEGGALILADGRRLEVKPVKPAVALDIDRQTVPLPDDLVEIEGQLLAPARPTLELLGIRWSWDGQAQSITMGGPFERFVLRVNSLKVELGPNVTEEMPVPPILYRGTLMVPLWAAMRASQAGGLYDPATRTLGLTSLERTMRDGAEGRLAPEGWGKGIGWREYFAAE
jgi:peptidoglycan-N-acetylglucosamine deacetylase